MSSSARMATAAVAEPLRPPTPALRIPRMEPSPPLATLLSALAGRPERALASHLQSRVAALPRDDTPGWVALYGEAADLGRRALASAEAEVASSRAELDRLQPTAALAGLGPKRSVEGVLEALRRWVGDSKSAWNERLGKQVDVFALDLDKLLAQTSFETYTQDDELIVAPDAASGQRLDAAFADWIEGYAGHLRQLFPSREPKLLAPALQLATELAPRCPAPALRPLEVALGVVPPALPEERIPWPGLAEATLKSFGGMMMRASSVTLLLAGLAQVAIPEQAGVRGPIGAALGVAAVPLAIVAVRKERARLRDRLPKRAEITLRERLRRDARDLIDRMKREALIQIDRHRSAEFRRFEQWADTDLRREVARAEAEQADAARSRAQRVPQLQSALSAAQMAAQQLRSLVPLLEQRRAALERGEV